MTPVLGGSPLGLLMVNSGQKNGFSTFNSTTERSINVNDYNGQKNNAASSGYGNSLFSELVLLEHGQVLKKYTQMMTFLDLERMILKKVVLVVIKIHNSNLGETYTTMMYTTQPY